MKYFERFATSIPSITFLPDGVLNLSPEQSYQAEKYLTNTAMLLSSSGPIVNVKSKLGPEIGSVMGWPSTHPPPKQFLSSSGPSLGQVPGQVQKYQV